MLYVLTPIDLMNFFSRLVCSVLRLRQLRPAVDLAHEIRHRRDVCFSQALTALASALMAKFWAADPEPAFVAACADPVSGHTRRTS